MKPRAFVAMPFGTQANIDFDEIYTLLIRPGVEAADLEIVRADDEQCAGDIRADMFQELLMADLVVADLSIPNPNVWYELGVRHALRARGVVLVYSAGATKPFDVYTDRKLRYTLKDGRLDPDKLQGERASLTEMVRQTMNAWSGRKLSPVYQLLPHLQEPDWKSLRVGAVREFWDAYEDWHGRVYRARKAGQIGDVLVLADEAPSSAFRAEVWIEAGRELTDSGRYKFALELLDRGLTIEPANRTGLLKKGVCLQRLGLARAEGHSPDRARAHYAKLLEQRPLDAEIHALLGRVFKDEWIDAWRGPGGTVQQMRERAAHEEPLLVAAIECYRRGYQSDPGHYYSGVNALTLMQLHQDVTGSTTYAAEISMMSGAVRYAASAEIARRERDATIDLFWAYATLGELAVVLGEPKQVEKEYRTAAAHSNKREFAIDSCRQQLLLFRDLGFALHNASTGLSVLELALQKFVEPGRWVPRNVFLFSGHMVDSADRPTPRFPLSYVPEAERALARVLDELAAGPDDLALTQGACGGDLLFSKACLARGVKLHWLQPFPEPEFIARSVAHCPGDWSKQYYELKPKLSVQRCAPEVLGAPPSYADSGYPYQRCNLWLLQTALAHGVDKVRFVCLWNGETGDGPGGTAHMYNEVKQRTGHVYRIDTTKLKQTVREGGMQP